MNSNLENAYIAPEAQQEHDDETLSVKKRQLEDEISAYRTELMHITNDSLEELESIIDNEEERKRYIAMYKKLIAEKQAEISGLVGKKLSQEEVTHLEELELTIPILETAITDITDELASMDKNDPKYVKISTYLQELISELKLLLKNEKKSKTSSISNN
jgi:transcription termination factor NusB